MKLWDLGLEAHFSLYVVTDLANSGPTPRAQMLYNALKLGAGGVSGEEFPNTRAGRSRTNFFAKEI